MWYNIDMKYGGPIVLAILDGVGLAPDGPGNAVSKARTPFLGRVVQEYPHIALDASGEAVGLVPGQMGNSEVGHNTMGAGRVIKQGIARVGDELKSGNVYKSEAWQNVINTTKKGGVLHFAGIFSDGGVHSDIFQLFQMIRQAYVEGVRKIRVHAVFDGRDTGPFSAMKYIDMFNRYIAEFPDLDIKIATGGGRMVYVADRYENDWQMVARGWDAMVNARADYYFKSPEEAITMLRRIDPNCQDQNLAPFVVVDEHDKPVGKIGKGDALVYFDFRADRAVEIAEAFTWWEFPYFNRGDYKPSDVYFAGMTEYNSDTHVPEHRLIEPVQFGETLNKFLGEHGVSQLAVSETVKFGHVTYYFNGNSYEKARGEDFIEIESGAEPFEKHPEMKTSEITDVVCEKMKDYQFVRLNYPGGDMVGHTADLEATRKALEAIDEGLSRLAEKVDEAHGMMIIVADHGNAEELLDAEGNKKTSHTTNRVPCIFYDNTENREKYKVADMDGAGLANLAATIAELMGFKDYPADWRASLIEPKFDIIEV